MHRSDVRTILLSAAVSPAVQKHHLQAAELLSAFKQLCPNDNPRLLQRAAILATKSKGAAGREHSFSQSLVHSR